MLLLFVSESDSETAERMIRNLPVVGLEAFKNPVNSIGSREIHVLGSLEKQLAGKRFAADAEVKPAVTSRLQTL